MIFNSFYCRQTGSSFRWGPTVGTHWHICCWGHTEAMSAVAGMNPSVPLCSQSSGMPTLTSLNGGVNPLVRQPQPITTTSPPPFIIQVNYMCDRTLDITNEQQTFHNFSETIKCSFNLYILNWENLTIPVQW